MKIGFIGTGNMGQAILEGFIVSEKVKKEDIFIYDPDQLKLDTLIKKYGVSTAENENKLAEKGYGYDPDAAKFVQHLDAVLAQFDANNK